ncbi:MAG: type II secretion system protein [Gemmatimonadota bacterium]|nr:type II secretion system protein [Gemmatimonadota bacterium]HEU4989402.1 type II secretion system protein [Gemmatimonadaceae bacterium]
MAAAGRPPRPPQGFTLLEIMIVLVMIGTLVVITRSQLDAPRYRVDAAIQMFRNALTQAQRTALLNQYDVIVVIDTVNQSLEVAEDVNNNDAIDAGEHTQNFPLTDHITFVVPPVGLDSTVTSAVVGSQLGSLGGLPTITFGRDGAATSDLQLYIATPATPTRTYRALELVQSTGRSDWYLYNSTANTWVIGGLR